ncbi:MAG: exo-alpha-sialidase, partial [Ignavibacteriaceae bacterium]|nr:exo-alpha-sialidase [Ignavibacteriaceae bacterium]
MLIHTKLFSFILLSTYILAQNSEKQTSLLIGENFRIFPGNASQTEVFSINHPYNQDIIFVSANTIVFSPFFISEGIYVTSNGGNNWYGSDTCKGTPIQLHGGDPGITINKNGTFILTRRGFSPGLYSHYSTDNGITWSNQKTITNDDLERASMTSDVHPSSSYYGRSYAAWVKFAPPFPINFAYTDNGGLTWSTPVAINNPIQRSAGGDMTMGPNGKVFVCWAGVTSVSPFTEDFVGFAYSTNGGTNWQRTENAFDINGINGLFPQKGNIRVNGLPDIAVDTTGGSRNGWIYIITTQRNLAPAGSDPDVILNRSTDGGQTWSAGIRVNQDPINNGKIQYFPAIHVDKTGGLNIIFYDDRNTTPDSTGVFLARSEDGGNTWKEFEISDKNFKPIPIG